jgi:hypothetical protein
MKAKLILFMACIILSICISTDLKAQSCTLTATATASPSQCKSTGSITVNVSDENGSGNYNYTVTGTSYSSTTSTNMISGLPAGIYNVVVKDIVNGCTTQVDSVIVGGSYQDPRFTLAETDVTCNGAANGTITVGNVQYGKAPFAYSIVAPSPSGVGTTNSTGYFTNLIPGDYTVQLNDSCGGLQTRIITISNHSWSITGTAVTKVNCDSANVVLTVTDNYGNVNTSGTNFSGYLYGYIISAGDTVWSSKNVFTFYKGTLRSASFVVKDPCNNISVSSWVDNAKPYASKTVGISNQTCNSFTATIQGQQNFTSPQFCLYTSANVLITCNTTGVFNSVAYGSYYIKITDNCYDTTFTRSFTASQLKPSISGVSVSGQNCSSFSATANTSNITNGQYCLYDSLGNQLICNTSGVFNNLNYGSYCVHVKNDPACYDTVLVKCFTVSKPTPSVNSSVTVTNGCNSFSAILGGQSNLTNPQFCLYDSANNQITCNTSGQFNNLAYGSYYIKMTNDPTCYDTTIIRSFSMSAVPASITVSASGSCTIGATDVAVQLANGIAPYVVKIYDAQNNLLSTTNTSSNSETVTGLPVSGTGSSYKIVVSGSCGSLDSATFTAKASSLSKTITAISKCPGASSQNGLGDLIVNVVYSGGRVTPQIISQNGSAVSINYSSVSGSTYTFANLSPAVYIIQYTLRKCSNLVYDTFTLKPYVFPSLAQSAVYQCNNNSFSVSSAVVGGVSPYTYAIIGSVPSSPSIIQGPQTSPVFNINNNTSYSVVRLRAMDACGNATINDASILPLGNTIIKATSNCINTNTILTVDSMSNATYIWYKKTSATDSTQIGTGPTYSIPSLSVADTGTYVNVESVNSGCLTKISTYYVNGVCLSILAVNDISFNGSLQNENAQLRWTTAQSFNAVQFIVEKSIDGLKFEAIGSVNVSSTNNIASSQYFFSDANTSTGKNFYRLRIVQANQSGNYTNVIEIDKKGIGAEISVMPNPVTDAFTIKFNQSSSGNYSVSLINPEGKNILSNMYSISTGDSKTIQRPAGILTGVYFLVIQNQATNEKEIIKLFLR